MDKNAHRLHETLGSRGTRWLRNLIGQLPEGVLIFDEERHILVSNPAAVVLLEAMSNSSEEHTDSLLGTALVEKILTDRQNDVPQTVEISDPVGRAFEVRAFPLSLETTQRHWMALIRETTQDREQQRLLDQQGRLAALGQLAAGISHDFNNLLTGILGYAELLARRPGTPPVAHRDADAICRLGRQGAQLVRQILDFSRQTDLRRCTVDLASSLDSMHSLLIRILPENIHLRLDIRPGAYPVLVNPIGLQQIITNLAVNARDAMPQGGELCLSLRRRILRRDFPRPIQSMPDGAWALLQVKDTGSGMPPQVLDRIFEPFFTTKEAGAGTGLGLSQVYGIVKQQQGYIFAVSAPSQGSTFTIWLRLQGQLSPEPPSDETPIPLPMGHGETILVVEDEREVLDVIEQMLTHLGYRSLSASNGAEAISLFETQGDEIALVLTDMMMPGMTGTDLFHAIRARDAQVKVIVLSGYPKAQVPDSEAVGGVNGWLRKPPDLASLGTLLATLLRTE